MFCGLPLGYIVGLLVAGVVPFIAFDSMWFLLIIPATYVPLWFIADKNPHLFEIMANVYSANPPTRNKDVHGGDNYGPMIVNPSSATQELLGNKIMKEAPAAKHIPYLIARADDVIMTRQGDLMASAILGGVDSLTSEEIDVDAMVDGFTRQVAQLGEQFGFYVNRITLPYNLDLKPVDYDGLSTIIDERWQRHLISRNLQDRVIMLTVSIRPSLADKFGFSSIFNSLKDTDSQRVELKERIEKLNEAMRLFEGFHKETGFRRLKVSDGDWLGLLSTIQGQSFQKRFAVPGQFLSHVCSSANYTFEDKVVIIDDGQRKRFGAMLGIHAYCSETVPIMLDKLEQPHNIVVTNSFTPLRRNATVEKMKLQRRQMEASEDAADSQREEMRLSADNVASGRQVYGDHQMSIMVTAESRKDLEKALSEVWQAAQETGTTLVRERADIGVFKGAFSTMFFGQAPCNWSYRPRKVMVSADNFADFAAFHKTSRGRSHDLTPWGQNITVFPTVTAGAYRFNFHEVGKASEEPSAGHTLVLGRPGSGKTLVTAFLMAQSRRVGARIIAFDKDQGLEMVIRALGGKYSNVKIGHATGLNPFSTETDDRGVAWLTDWLNDILSKGGSLSTVQSVALTQAVKQIAIAQPQLRNFGGLESLITSTDDDGELLARVQEWTIKGRYGWMFSKVADTSMDVSEEIAGIDMSEILDLDVERSAMLAYLFRRIERVIEDRKPTMIVIDEAWKMLNDKIFVKRLQDWLVTMRKKNCVVIMLTQTPGHLEQSHVGSIITETVNTQILFPNNRAKPDDYKILRTNESETAFLCAGAGGHRIALMRSGGDSVFVDVDLGGIDGALTVLGGGRTGAEKAPRNWQTKADFWKDMI